MSTLVIWEQVPESTTMYVIPDTEITPEIAGLLAEAHGKFINNDDENDGLEFLNAALTPEDGRIAKKPVNKGKKGAKADAPKGYEPPSDTFFKNQCIWSKYKVEGDKPLDTTANPITRVVLSGFVM